MKVLIAGGTGALGTALTAFLRERKNTVNHLSRSSPEEKYRWDPERGQVAIEALDEADVIVNLCGAGLADRRWTSSYKKVLLNSRVQPARLLADSLKVCTPRPRHLISASGVSYYGDRADWVDETAAAGTGFLAGLCVEWEQAALSAQSAHTRVSLLRTGVVLQPGQGFLAAMESLARKGLLAALGSGKQTMSWIHIDDYCGMIAHLMEHRLGGIYNAVSPAPVSNAEMTKALAKSFRALYFMPNVPAFALHLVVGGIAEELLARHRVSSRKLEESGYRFRHGDLAPALSA